jgi:hypothetical protein
MHIKHDNLIPFVEISHHIQLVPTNELGICNLFVNLVHFVVDNMTLNVIEQPISIRIEFEYIAALNFALFRKVLAFLLAP